MREGSRFWFCTIIKKNHNRSKKQRFSQTTADRNTCNMHFQDTQKESPTDNPQGFFLLDCIL